jgi:O-antigen ligase
VETENKGSGVTRIWNQPAIWVALFGGIYLAVLPMAGTIALRNLALVGLMISVVCGTSQFQKQDFPGLAVAVWAVYLMLFPLLADDHATAWFSLREQWIRGLLAMAVGAAAAAILARRNWANPFTLGAVSLVTLLVHLGLFFTKAAQTHQIPWGYWGRETHHADLGYAAGHAVVLLTVTFLTGERKYRGWAAALIAAALLSTLLAESRAGLAFAVFGGACVIACVYPFNMLQMKRYGYALVVLAVVAVGLMGLAVKVDPRWGKMADELHAGFMGDAIEIECKGMDVVQAQIVAANGPGAKADQLVSSVRYGDGSRMVVLRAGLELAWAHPLGGDGSRQAFQKLLRQECPNPVISMAHAHNGWIDTMLAIGIPGAALYMWVLLSFLRSGYAALKRDGLANPWALVLLSLSVFWIVRGFTDSVFRDHMFEMQGFMLSFALIASRRLHAPQEPTQPAGQVG